MRRVIFKDGKPAKLIMEVAGSLGETKPGSNTVVDFSDVYIRTEFVDYGQNEMDPDMKNISEYVKIIRQAHVTKVNTIRDAFENGNSNKEILDVNGIIYAVLASEHKTYAKAYEDAFRKNVRFRYTFVNKYTHHVVGMYDDYLRIESFDRLLLDVRHELVEEIYATLPNQQFALLPEFTIESLTKLIHDLRYDTQIPDPSEVKCEPTMSADYATEETK